MQMHSTDLRHPPRRQWWPFILTLVFGLAALVVVIPLAFFSVRYTARSSPTATAPAAPASTFAPAPIRLSGDLSQNTAPFRLAAGTYVAAFKTELLDGRSSCATSADLHRVADKRRVETIYSTTLWRDDGRTSAAGETRLYGITAGDYYLDADTTACSWSVEIRPV